MNQEALNVLINEAGELEDLNIPGFDISYPAPESYNIVKRGDVEKSIPDIIGNDLDYNSVVKFILDNT